MTVPREAVSVAEDASMHEVRNASLERFDALTTLGKILI